MENPSVKIDTEYITLGQLLKMVDVIQSGGQAKFFLEDIPVWVNAERENRRGKKLYPGDQVKIDDMGEYQIIRET